MGGAAAVVAAPLVAAMPKPVPKPVPPARPLPPKSFYQGRTVTLVDDTFVVRRRKLKAVWSMEAAQDLRMMHNIDAERDLMEILAKEIQADIDKEVLGDLRRLAAA